MAHFESKPEANKNRSLARWLGAALLGGVLIVTQGCLAGAAGDKAAPDGDPGTASQAQRGGTEWSRIAERVRGSLPSVERIKGIKVPAVRAAALELHDALDAFANGDVSSPGKAETLVARIREAGGRVRAAIDQASGGVDLRSRRLTPTSSYWVWCSGTGWVLCDTSSPCSCPGTTPTPPTPGNYVTCLHVCSDTFTTCLNADGSAVIPICGTLFLNCMLQC